MLLNITIFTTTYYVVSRGKNSVNNCDPTIVLVPYMVAEFDALLQLHGENVYAPKRCLTLELAMAQYKFHS